MMKNSNLNINKKIYFIILCIALVLLMPLLLMGRYDHMAADDYAFGLFAHQAWEKSHSLFNVFSAAIEYSWWVYRHWQGTYASVFLMCLQPGIFGEKLYFLTPFITIGSLTVGVTTFVSSFCTNVLNAEKYTSKGLGILISLVCIEYVETPVEAFYWFNGSVHYTVMQGLLLFLLGKVFSEVCSTTVKKKNVIIYVLLAAFVGGANYMTALSAVLIETAILVLLYFKRNKNLGIVALILSSSFFGLLLNVLAPGNHTRQSIYKGYSVIETVYKAFEVGFENINKWTTLSIFILGIIFFPIIYLCVKNSKFSFRYPGMFFLVTICLFCAQYAPSLYATRSSGPCRLINATQYMFYLYFFLNEIYLTGFLCRNCNLEVVFHRLKFAVLFLLISYFFVASFQGYNSYTSLSAIHSMATNEAQLYHYHMCQREKNLKNSDTNGCDVVLVSMPVCPKLITYEDANGDPSSPFNTAIAAYYNKNSIVVEPFHENE